MTHERVYRWRVGVVGVVALVALGLLYASPLLLAASVVPLGYVVYGSLSSVPSDAAVRIERRFDGGTPPPGERVTVTLTIENVSEATLADLRVVDGVPDELAVVRGSPRRSLSLRPGESATLRYAVVAKRGEFDFADPLVRLRPLSGAHVVTEAVPVAGAVTLSALNPVSDAPVRNATMLRAGTHPTDSGGDGIEFRSTREYRPGDPISRIHWRRYAKTNELTTISFREERSVRTVVIVDARPVGRVAPRPGVPTATELCGYAGERLYEALVDADVVTSVTALGVDAADPDVPAGPGGLPWVDGDAADAAALSRLLFRAVQAVAEEPGSTGGRGRSGGPGQSVGVGATHSGPDAASAAPDSSTGAAAPAPPREGDGDGVPAPDGGWERVRLLFEQFPPTAQVVFVSPLLDDWTVEFVQRIRQRDYPITVVSPDATGGESLGQSVAGSLGQSVAGLERRLRLRQLSAAGATTVSWRRDESIEVALTDSLTHLLGGENG